MSILDQVLFNPEAPLSRSCFDTMYAICVTRAEEWEAAIRELEAVRTGEPEMPVGRWRQIEVRCMSEERIRWGTTRNAVEGRNWDASQLDSSTGQNGGSTPILPPPHTGSRGGLVLSCLDKSVRPWIDPRTYVPATVGPFTFPAPYFTQGLRLTDPSYGRVNPIGMTYWNNLSCPDPNLLLVLLSLEDQLTVLALNPTTLADLDIRTIPFHHTGEGCYWLRDRPTVLAIPQGRELLGYDVRTERTETLATMPADATQWHSSADGRTHSCTCAGRPAYATEGRVQVLDPVGGYDECQIDKSGRYLLVKWEADVYLLDLRTGDRGGIRNTEGAPGHSDSGFGYVIGEDDYDAHAGAFRLWGGLGVKGPVVYHEHDWARASRYVAHGNAVDAPPGGQVALFVNNATTDAPRTNELILARLDGSLQACVVCPTLTSLAAPGVEEYWRAARPNLDATGRFAVWTGNLGSDRLDAFLVRLPRF